MLCSGGIASQWLSAPIWGNLSNTGMGGCQVETAAQVSGGSKVEIGLWVASGKIWVKGLALNGVVTRSAPAAGVGIRFEGMDAVEKKISGSFLNMFRKPREPRLVKAAICSC